MLFFFLNILTINLFITHSSNAYQDQIPFLKDLNTFPDDFLIFYLFINLECNNRYSILMRCIRIQDWIRLKWYGFLTSNDTILNLKVTLEIIPAGFFFSLKIPPDSNLHFLPYLVFTLELRSLVHFPTFSLIHWRCLCLE